MDESDEYDPILPDDLVPTKRSSEPPPLKRLWKEPADEPEGVADTEAPDVKKKTKVAEPAPKPKPKVAKPKLALKKKVEPEMDDGTGAVKLEKTPVLDTYEARQRARWLIVGLGSGCFLILAFIIWGASRGGENSDVREGDPPDPRTISEKSPPPADNRSSDEIVAKNMLENARQADKLGKVPAAVNLLNRLIKAYPITTAAREAQTALDRYKLNQSLFGTELVGQDLAPKRPPGAEPSASGETVTPPSAASNTTKPGPEPVKPPENSKNVVMAPPPPPPVNLRSLPSGYRPNFDFPIHPSGWPTRILCDFDGGDLVLIPGGTFDMGRSDGEVQERPVHRVNLSTYYIDLHEVTVRQYLIFCKESGRSLEAVKKAVTKSAAPAQIDDYPVTMVSANEAKAFCVWAKRTLPTEAQWEMAGRSTTGRISFWNEQMPRPDPAKGSRVMEPVMSLPSDVSAYGVLDLGANAWEWTSDYYDSQYYKQFNNLVTDPPGPKEPRTSIVLMSVRGGSKSGTLTWRVGQKTETRLPYLGFRGALTVEFAPAAPTTNGTQTAPPAAGSSSKSAGQPF